MEDIKKFSDDIIVKMQKSFKLCNDLLETMKDDFCLETGSIIYKIKGYKEIRNIFCTFGWLLEFLKEEHKKSAETILQLTQKLTDCVYIKEEPECETYITICLNEKKLESIGKPHNNDFPFQMWMIINAIESIIRFLEHTGDSERLSYHDSVYYLKVPKKAYTHAT